MKIAYCFFGHLRTFRQTLSLKHELLAHQPGDVFVHTYSRHNASSTLWHGNNGGSNEPTTTDDVAWLHANYSPRALIVDIADGGAGYLPPAYVHAAGRYSSSRSIGLRREYERATGAAYDCVMLLRFDLALAGRFTLPLPTPRTLYGSHVKREGKETLDGDVYLYGTSHVMDAMVGSALLPFSDAEVAATGFVGERLTTALRKRLGFAYAAHTPQVGSLLRPGGGVTSFG